jgi:hypothetical protein
MRSKTIAETAQLAGKGQSPDTQHRINAGWLRLWKAVCPNTPPPTKDRGVRGEGRAAKGKERGLSARRPAVLDLLSRLLAGWLVLALLVAGCAGRPLKGGKAAINRKPAGGVEQTVVQGENAAQATKQDQETVTVRTYTLPAGSRVEQSQTPGTVASQADSPAPVAPQPSTLNPLTRPGAATAAQPLTSFILSAPMPVVEREETRARTELGAAQKDTARELGAKLSSLKGIVWVGVGLFVFGLASLVYPPLKVIVASVTTSAALMLGGLALMVLPTMVAGNELLILGVVTLAVGGWFLAHRHGQLRGVVAASTPNPTAKAVVSDP